MAPGGKSQVVALLGDPVGHSASPAMHNAAFAALGLREWVYVALRVRAPQLADAVRGLRALGFAGANVTIPHKRGVVPWLDALTPAAQLAGAVNTVRVNERGRLVGDNTDIGGLMRQLAEHEIAVAGRTVLVLGAGGAARAVAVAAWQLGAHRILVAARRPEAGEGLIRSVGARASAELPPLPAMEVLPLGVDALAGVLPQVDMVVNATPLGMEGVGGGEAPARWADPARLRQEAVVCDLVYRPPETPLLQAARARGLRALGGAGMLLYQGVLAFEAWTGRPAPVPVMREALYAQLGLSARDHATQTGAEMAGGGSEARALREG